MPDRHRYRHADVQMDGRSTHSTDGSVIAAVAFFIDFFGPAEKSGCADIFDPVGYAGQ